jgi:hypothetical protein
MHLSLQPEVLFASVAAAREIVLFSLCFGGGLLVDGGGVLVDAALVDGGVESGLGVGLVVHGAQRTVGLDQAVQSLDDATLAVLPLLLLVAGVRVVHGVLELVGWLVVILGRVQIVFSHIRDFLVN